ncbi:hypothetical protein J7T55_007397 [Diaporthe amygdali]|uniref:uncharacterized protein n=1 Tax=Phomopsis amygdali TaxID=1214568 RepID=UPI0022FE5AA2|nr:uncharacterized protein J7T55_007397 [Diaporthe amygdali]KAJ0116417.1 hypothetical protein J7T55_007397 [Diaporthe amygdali]
MNAPPVLRPLRAILQRRLQLVPSRPIRTPYYVRASQLRPQLRCNSSIPKDQTFKSDSSAEEPAKEPSQDTQASRTASPAEEVQDVNPEEHLEPPERPEATKGEIEVHQAEPADFAQVVPGEPVAESEVTVIEPTSLKEAALPKFNDALIKSAFKRVKAASAEIEAGISEVVARQIEAAEAAATSETQEEIPTPGPDHAFVRSKMQEVEALSSQIRVGLHEFEQLGLQAAQEVETILENPAVTAKSEGALPDEIVKAAEEVRETEEIGAGETETSELVFLTATEAQEIVNEKIATAELNEAPSQQPTPQSDSKATAAKKQGRKSKHEGLNAAVEKELRNRTEESAANLVEAEDDVPDEPSRLPRNVQAFYLQPLRREAKYNLPSCNLQLRSYSVRPLESFCDFALRAAYYLGLPAYGPTPLPKIIQRWTVPKSSFIFKKSQENFERITRRRLIQIRDGHPETVQIWLAFLQKHQQAGVGMKANVWEFSSLDVAKELDQAYEEAKPIIDKKFNLLGQDREIATVEKVDEILTSERYKLAGARAAEVASSHNVYPPTQSSSPPSPYQRRAATTTTTTTTTSFKDASPRVIFSGIQPTGVPHLGNYLGALSQWATLQNEAAADSTNSTRLLFSVVDLHAITLPQEASQLRAWRREMLAALLAVGLDPARSTIFHQSSVPAHAELMWVLSCTASMGYLSRMTQWKSKMSLPEDTSALPTDDRVGGGANKAAALKLGLFSYPVLQAADILVHRATHVPVGEDQRQHLEFARECATGFNHAHGGGGGGNPGILVPPETIVSPARRVMSLTDPTKKMSKSDANPASRVLITDAPAEIRKKVMRAVTDSQSGSVSYDPESRPGVSNLLEILAILEGEERTPAEAAAGFAGSQHPLKALKERTADAIVAELRDVRERYFELMGHNDGKELDEIEARGAEKARASADVTMKLVKEAVGL